MVSCRCSSRCRRGGIPACRRSARLGDDEAGGGLPRRDHSSPYAQRRPPNSGRCIRRIGLVAGGLSPSFRAMCVLPAPLMTMLLPSVSLTGSPWPATGVSFCGLTSMLKVCKPLIWLPLDTSKVKLAVKSSLPSCRNRTRPASMSAWVKEPSRPSGVPLSRMLPLEGRLAGGR